MVWYTQNKQTHNHKWNLFMVHIAQVILAIWRTKTTLSEIQRYPVFLLKIGPNCLTTLTLLENWNNTVGTTLSPGMRRPQGSVVSFLLKRGSNGHTRWVQLYDRIWPLRKLVNFRFRQKQGGPYSPKWVTSFSTVSIV